MMRLAYFCYRIGSTILYRLGRRLTGAGWLALTAMVWTGAIGVDLEQSVASQTFAVLLSLFVVAILWAFLFRIRFSAERLLPRFGSVGHPFVYRVSVRNLGVKRWPELELFDELADRLPTWKQFNEARRSGAGSRSFRLTKIKPDSAGHRRAAVKSVSLPPLLPRGEAEARLEVVPLKRGPLRLKGLALTLRDPLGLIRGFARLSRSQMVLILPKRYLLPAIALPGAHKYQQGGVALAASVGESEEFVSVRDYRPGDPLRHVHWRSTARTGRLVVKEFEDEFFVRHALVLDTFGAPEQAEAFEEAVSVAASFAATVATQESLLDLMFVGARAVCFTTGRGMAHAEQALEILASVQPCGTQAFNALETLVLQHASLVSGCICIFLAWDKARRDLIQKLTTFGLPLLVMVITDEAGAEQLNSLAPSECPRNFCVLQVGKIQAGLRDLERVDV